MYLNKHLQTLKYLTITSCAHFILFLYLSLTMFCSVISLHCRALEFPVPIQCKNGASCFVNLAQNKQAGAQTTKKKIIFRNLKHLILI